MSSVRGAASWRIQRGCDAPGVSISLPAGDRVLVEPRRPGPGASAGFGLGRRVAWLVAIVALLGCGGPEASPFRLEAGAEGSSEPGQPLPPELRLPEATRWTTATYHLEERAVVEMPVVPWQWEGVVPAGARLSFGAQLAPGSWRREVGRLDIQVELRRGRHREVLEALHAGGKHRDRYWLDAVVDLGQYAGERVTITVSPAVEGLDPGTARMVWGPVSLSVPPADDGPPNILFVLVDTLRYDHLGTYGYARDTSPEIDAVARGGVVFEEAYSPAPWTLPSMVGLFSGRYPSEVLGEDPATYAMPPTPGLPERLAALGYRTAGFIANPTLHPGNGFARGFSTFYSPGSDVQLLQQHAEEVASRATSWLAAHQDDRFFAYLHFIDPHDPYTNPDMPGDRSPFLPDYQGFIRGTHVHGIHVGRITLPDPVADREQITALYDGEIRYVDRAIGEVLRSLRPEVLARTLIVITSDHGEELFDHGGWKHGQTLYEEQIHVPLVLRWDGRIAPGRRVAGTVRTIDLMPTLLQVAGDAAVDPDWDGIDLSPVLFAEASVPRRPAYAQHLTLGPLRAAAVLDRRKLILFNRELPFDPGANQMQVHLTALDRARLQRAELYDLEADPREKHNQVEGQPAEVRRLLPVIESRLDDSLPGLRVLVDGAPVGTRVSGRLRFDRAPGGRLPWLLAADDEATLSGDELRFAVTAEAVPKGVLLVGDFTRVEVLELRVEGGEGLAARGPAGPVPLGAGVGREQLAGGRPSGEAVGLVLWEPAVRERQAGEVNEETLARLKALGYLQ
jgi:arylsulfatase A-like enzyme